MSLSWPAVEYEALGQRGPARGLVRGVGMLVPDPSQIST